LHSCSPCSTPGNTRNNPIIYLIKCKWYFYYFYFWWTNRVKWVELDVREWLERSTGNRPFPRLLTRLLSRLLYCFHGSTKGIPYCVGNPSQRPAPALDTIWVWLKPESTKALLPPFPSL
jgi:hypothetical protein